MSLDRCFTSVSSITLGLALVLGGCAAQTQSDPPAAGTEEQAANPQGDDERVGTASSEIIAAPLGAPLGWGGVGWGGVGWGRVGWGGLGWGGLGCGGLGWGVGVPACGAGFGVAAPIGACGAVPLGFGFGRAVGFGVGVAGACGGIGGCVW
jgi:hypothetical protein